MIKRSLKLPQLIPAEKKPKSAVTSIAKNTYGIIDRYHTCDLFVIHRDRSHRWEILGEFLSIRQKGKDDWIRWMASDVVPLCRSFLFHSGLKGWRDILGHWTTQRRIDSVAKRSPLSTTNYFFLAITLRCWARLRVWNTLRGAQCRNAGPGPAIEQLNLISVMDSDRNANYSAGTSDFELLARIPRYLLR